MKNSDKFGFDLEKVKPSRRGRGRGIKLRGGARDGVQVGVAGKIIFKKIRFTKPSSKIGTGLDIVEKPERGRGRGVVRRGGK